MLTITELCNGAKHLDLKGRDRPPVGQYSKHWTDRPIASVHVSPHMAMTESETMFVVTVDGHGQDVLDVAEEALAHWRGFLQSAGLPLPD